MKVSDNEEIIVDCLSELEPFIKSVRLKIKVLEENAFSTDQELIEIQET